MKSFTTVNITDIKINKFSRYIEVILGEGRSLMQFKPEIPCLLNDINTDLINFYKFIHEPELQAELNAFASNWDLIGNFYSFSIGEIFMTFQDLEKNIISTDDVEFIIRAIVMMNMNQEKFAPIFEKKFVVSIDMFTNSLIKNIVDTLLKIKGNKLVEECNNNHNSFNIYLETAFRLGFFDHFKNLINWQKTELIDCICLSKHLACWYFIKEFSKGIHLNYDQNGNIKNNYGGSDYNNKQITDKVKKLTNTDFLSKIKKAKLHNSSATDFLNEIKVNKNDVVVANLMDNNVVLANGKNYSSINSLLDQIKLIVNLNTNLIILTNDEVFAMELEQISEKKLKTLKSNEGFLVSNFLA